MSFTVKYYQFKKDTNSTKRPPSGTVTWTSTLEIIEPCSLMYPRIKVRRTNAPYPEEPGDYTKDLYNYCYIEEFSRYYWIDNWTYDNGLWIASLTCDVLATYRSQIGAESMYILRASAASDGNIKDNYYPIVNSATYKTQLKQPFYSSYTSGFYVVNVMGTGTTGNSTLWKMSPSKFRSFIGNLYNNIDGYQFADVIEAVGKLAGGQPEKLVSSAMWFPNGVSFLTDAADTVVVGGWDSGVTANKISDPKSTTTVTFDIEKHPLAATRGSYLNLSPYSMYYLTIPIFGTIALDTTLLINQTEISVDFQVDAVSGAAVAIIFSKPAYEILACLSGQMGVTLPLAGQSAGANIVGGAAATAVSTIGAIATGGAAAIAGAVESGIGTIVGSITGASSSTGSCGNTIAPGAIWELDSIFYGIANEDNAKNGRPLCQVRTPASLGGFMIVQRGDVPIYGTREEADAIRSILESGFYYE